MLSSFSIIDKNSTLMHVYIFVKLFTVNSVRNPEKTSQEMYEIKQKQRRFEFAEKHKVSKCNQQSNSYDVLERNIGMLKN